MNDVKEINNIMTNVELLQLIKSKIENVRNEINDLSLNIVEDQNYDLIFDTLSTELESDLCNAIDTINLLIDDVEDNI
jgi:hypothetical protein